MDDPRPQSTIPSGTYPEDWIQVSYSRILNCCRSAGLAPSEADDIAQDIWLWLLRDGGPARAASMPWLTAVARNFILRYRRRKFRRSALEGCPPAACPAARAPEGCSLDSCPRASAREIWPELETEDLLDRLADALPETERRMLALIRSGHSLAESARLLGVPRGSQGYHQRRLVACARQELAGRGDLPDYDEGPDDSDSKKRSRQVCVASSPVRKQALTRSPIRTGPSPIR